MVWGVYNPASQRTRVKSVISSPTVSSMNQRSIAVRGSPVGVGLPSV